MPRRPLRRLTLLTSVLLLVLAATAASALAAGALNVDPVQLRPAQSQQLTPGQPVQFRVVTDCINQEMFAVVSNLSTLADDGTLAAGLQDKVTMEGAADGTYVGTTTGSWTNTPGTYYWQAQINGDCGGLGKQIWLGPLVAITVLPATTASGTEVAETQDNGEILSIPQARAAIRDGVLKLTRKLPRGLKRTCGRQGSGSILAVLCTSSWNDKKKYAYNGTWRMALNDDGTIEARFDGRRATLKCLRKSSQRRRCYKKWRRTVVIG